MTIKSRVIAITLATVVAPAAACSSGHSATARTTVTMDASWAEYYHSLSTLKAHSELAVEGTITGVKSVSSAHGIPFTDFEFTVSSTLFDPGHRVTIGKAVVIHQTGGTMNGRQFQVDDDPVFHVGEHLVLFLREPQPGLYMVVGGPTGRFEVGNGALTPAVKDGVKFTGSTQAFASAVSKS
jgi:hypothetical protein